MENASRAMMMAAGMFIAIAIISVALYAYSNAKGFANASEELLSASQIQGFNRFYTAYGDGTFKQIKCIDAINILNRAVEDNLAINENSSKIESETDATSGNQIYKVAGDHTEYYIQNVSFTYSRDVEGKVNGVNVFD